MLANSQIFRGKFLVKQRGSHAGLTLLPFHTWYSLLRPGPGSPMAVRISTSRPPRSDPIRPPKINKQTCGAERTAARPFPPSPPASSVLDHEDRERAPGTKKTLGTAALLSLRSRLRFGGEGSRSPDLPRMQPAPLHLRRALALIGCLMRQRRGKTIIGGGLTTAAWAGRVVPACTNDVTGWPGGLARPEEGRGARMAASAGSTY